MDSEEVSLLINQAELHYRSARAELNELGRALDAIRGAI